MIYEEEIDYVKKVYEGDEEVSKKFIELNLRFVVSIVKKYINRGLKFFDLI